MNVPTDLKYTKNHEWVRAEGGIATIGITDHAQSELGDIVFIELPEVGDEFEKDTAIGTIEAVKTVADMNTPVSGEIIEVNGALEDSSELMNKDPYSDGWIAKLRMSDESELDELLSAEEYKELIG
ncbi:MAG: glycine cleavage system protein GcvH [Candidatus Marinimicrobia bacterium]|nr:glycine cleavage system protein GcvH [Candidatus Neomarinimicrobiota bacterium]